MSSPPGPYIGWRRTRVQRGWSGVVTAPSRREAWRRLSGYLAGEGGCGYASVTDGMPDPSQRTDARVSEYGGGVLFD